MATVVLFMSPVFDLKSKQSRWKATWSDFILQGSLAALQRIDRWGKVGGDGGPVDVERAIVSQGGSGSGHSRSRVRPRETGPRDISGGRHEDL